MICAVSLLIANRVIVGGILGATAFRRRVLVLGAGPRAQRLRELGEQRDAASPSSLHRHGRQDKVVEEAIARARIHNLTRYVQNLGRQRSRAGAGRAAVMRCR